MKIDPAIISVSTKKQYLKQFSEKDFRDKVLRPLFNRMGKNRVREIHGADEEGKDLYFVVPGFLNKHEVYAIQTKAGNLNMSSKHNENILIAKTQIETALNTKIAVVEEDISTYPHKVILCCSGIINRAARENIMEINDTRIEFLDSEILIPEIDKLFPELWFGIDARRNPYLNALKEHLINLADTIPLQEVGIKCPDYSPVSDELFMQISAHRFLAKPVKYRGQVRREPKIEELSVTRLVEHGEKLIILYGEAGDGKSTAFKKIAFDMASKSLGEIKNATVPVLMRCSDLADSELSAAEVAANITAHIANSNFPAFSIDELELGNILLLADGLDEVMSDTDRVSVLCKLLEFHKDYPRCKVIVSSRPYQAIKNIPEVEKFCKFMISDFEVKQARKLVETIASGRDLQPNATRELMRKLQDVHGFQLNPLLVTIFAATADCNHRDIPANMTELLKKFTELMLGRWDARKGLKQQCEPVIMDFLLMSAALEMHRNRKTYLSINRFKSLIVDSLNDRGLQANVEDYLDVFLTRSGLLRVDGNKIEFRHLLLQEFFAGRASDSIDDFKAYLYDEWWRTVIVFHFGERPQSINKLDELINHANSLNGENLFNSAMVIGLSLQACYLSKIVDKIKVLQWVLAALARTCPSIIEYLDDEEKKYPLTIFINYYLRGRDAIATRLLEEIENTPQDELLTFTYDDNNSFQDAYQFWYIAGLIESGAIDKAQQILKEFTPKDTRLLLALFLGCLLLAHLKISTSEEKGIAHEIAEYLRPKIEPLTQMVLTEHNSLLLEMRCKKIKAIENDDISTD